jgi:hypothetical protein
VLPAIIEAIHTASKVYLTVFLGFEKEYLSRLRFFLPVRRAIHAITSCNIPIGQMTEQYNLPNISVISSNEATIHRLPRSIAGIN